jgi:hypothetical protein
MSDPITPVTTPVVDPPAPVTPPVVPAAPVADDVASLPDWAQKLLGKTRTEAATNRTKASEASDALTATRDAIAKALGLAPSDDPVVAAKTAADERDAARQEAKAVKVENAVLKAARKHEADPEALTDSRSFMAKLAGIDPAADDFAAQVDAAIKAAVSTNPLLKVGPAVPPPPARSGGSVGGGVPIPGQLSREDIKGWKPEAIEEARVAGRLNALLGIT